MTEKADESIGAVLEARDVFDRLYEFYPITEGGDYVIGVNALLDEEVESVIGYDHLGYNHFNKNIVLESIIDFNHGNAPLIYNYIKTVSNLHPH